MNIYPWEVSDPRIPGAMPNPVNQYVRSHILMLEDVNQRLSALETTIENIQEYIRRLKIDRAELPTMAGRTISNRGLSNKLSKDTANNIMSFVQKKRRSRKRAKTKKKQ